MVFDLDFPIRERNGEDRLPILDLSMIDIPSYWTYKKTNTGHDF